MAVLPYILCVDDEPQILQGLTLHLRRNYQVVTAEGGAAALQIVAAGSPPAVVVSDMRMPGMDGAALLKRMLQLHPETTRILLTGEPSRDSAAAAVNEGQIFRFLTKPCAPDELRAAVEAGVIQHRLVTAEKVLMQETLIGCINALIDVLAMTNPVAFGRTNRVKRMVIDLAAVSGHAEFWQLEAAAMLSQIGYISLPAELVEKLYYGRRLTAEERALADGAPRVAQALLGRIPRIESVMEILTVSQDRTAGTGGDGLLKTGADILRLILAYDALIVAGNSRNAALQSLRSRADVYGTPLIDSLAGMIGADAEEQDVFELPVASVKPGMIILDDLRTTVGTLLVPKGFEVTNAFLERKRNFDAAILQTKVRVMGMAGEQRRVQPH
jgi:response regulator RpfG family c-di-GMP phosphodiesterase